MGTAIKIDGIGKRYYTGEIGTKSIKGDLQRLGAKIAGKPDPFQIIGEEGERENGYSWALKDLSFSVNQGEIFGVVGKNGAGKSTLLKLLSRITTPTKGVIEITGKLASLLEVGTGFHPELTGRENIYMNGLIMGMKKPEIKHHLDEIIHFSGVENYIDTPVKRYSSGMYVRLGFAVAAHLSSDILIVDEVLAVGDADFQKKAIGKMKDVSQFSGRTVLFVSHNLLSVKSLCTQGVLLEKGRLKYQGGINDVLDVYSGFDINPIRKWQEGYDCMEFSLHEITLLSVGNNWDENNEVSMKIKGVIKEIHRKLRINVEVCDSLGNILFSHSSGAANLNLEFNGEICILCRFPPKFFNVGKFIINVMVLKEEQQLLLYLNNCLNFEIVSSKRDLGEWMGVEPGFIRPNLLWELSRKH